MSTSSDSTRFSDGAGVVRKVRRSILPVAFLLYTFNYMDRASISYAQLEMSSDLGIDIATYGAAAAVFFIAYVLLEVPSNIIMSKIGARLWLSRIAITWGIVTVLTGFVESTTHLFVARVALGIAEAGLFPGLVLYLTYWFRTQDRSRGLAGMVLAQPIALIVGSVTGGLILGHVDWFGLESWRWVFILQGLPPILLGIWVLLYLADRPSKARWLSREESGWLEGEIAREYRGDRGEHKSVNLRALKSPKVLYLSFIFMLGGVGTYGMTFFVPQVIAQLNPGYSPTNIGFVGAIPYICGGVAMLVIARWSDLIGNRKHIVMGCLATSVVGLVLTIVFQDIPAVGVLGLSLLAIGILAYIPPFWALVSESLTRAESAVGLALINSVASAGGFVGPYLIGVVAQATTVTFGLVVPAACLALAVVLVLFVKPAEDSPAAQTQTA